MKIYQYAMRAHRETRAAYMVCEKTFNSKDEIHLDCPDKLAEFLNEYADASELPNEKTWLFCFDASLRLLGFSEVTQGVHDQAMFDIKRTMQLALMSGAYAISVAHNHPSGACQPSDPDLQSTKRLEEACRILDIKCLDHIIVGYKGYVSLREMGVMH